MFSDFFNGAEVQIAMTKFVAADDARFSHFQLHEGLFLPSNICDGPLQRSDFSLKMEDLPSEDWRITDNQEDEGACQSAGPIPMHE